MELQGKAGSLHGAICGCLNSTEVLNVRARAMALAKVACLSELAGLVYIDTGYLVHVV